MHIHHRLGYGALLGISLIQTTWCYDQAYVDQIANTHLNSYEVIESNTNTQEETKFLDKSPWEHIQELWRTRVCPLAPLTERDYLEIAFKQMASKPLNYPACIDHALVHKMELIQGAERPTDHLAHRLTTHQGSNLLATSMGKKRCVELLCQPTSNLSVLHQRQAVIRELYSNDELLRKCTAVLEKIKASEPYLFDLYTHSEISQEEKLLYFDETVFNYLNQNATSLSLSTRFGQLMQGITSATCIATLPTIEYIHQRVHRVPLLFRTYGPLGAFLGITMLGVQKSLIKMTQNIQEKLIGAATSINGAQVLIKLLNGNETIHTVMPELSRCLQQLNNTQSPEFDALLSSMRKSTFAPGKPSFFSSPGTILTTYRSFIAGNVRQHFNDLFTMLGELDLYVAIARKMKLSQSMPNRYCFTQSIQAKEPLLQSKGLWNPFLPADKAIPNDIALGSPHNRNIILTGPNTGGKSTILKAIMINTLLAQTFGIAAADEFTYTPFTTLLCHMNITDDTSAGASLFKAEVDRAHDLLNAVRKLKSNQYACIIIDEIFTGTSPEQAEKLSHQFIEKLSSFPRLIFINATHFKKLTNLETETNGICANYHMGAETDPEGTVTAYTYTLTPGVSPVSNAAQIAHEEGIFF